MRKQFWRIFIGMLFIFSFWAVQGFAQTDPTTAVSLPLNGSSTGTLSATQNVNWWKIVMTSDGRLIVNVQVVNSSITLQLFDNGGTRPVPATVTGGGDNYALRNNNLMQGTYYVRIDRSTGGGNYSISNTFTPTSFNVEQEPNDTPGQSLTLDANGSDRGHLGFYGNALTDNIDWWKVTIPKDGKLLITTETAATDTLKVSLELYENQGSKLIKSAGAGSGKTTTLNFDNLMPGTFYIKVGLVSSFGSYTIRSTFTATTYDVETEPNDSTLVALKLDPNTSTTAHLGFYGAGYTDTKDWWKVTIPKDGKLIFTTEAAIPDSNLTINLELYSNQGQQLIKSANTGWGKLSTLNYNNLMAGTYYLKAFLGAGSGSYRITAAYSYVYYAIDTEKNDTSGNAVPITPNTLWTGHLGYFGDTGYDTSDFFSFTVPSGWDTLFVRFKIDATLSPILNIYNSNGAIIAGNFYQTYTMVKPPAGTYRLQIAMNSGYGGYAFIVQNSWRADVPVIDPTQISPPANLVAADIPNDQGHRIKLTWTPSVSENNGLITWYRILRSRSNVLTTPVSIKQFGTIDSLISRERTITVLIDSVAAGVKEYIDQSIPMTGVYYYYWLQAVGLFGVSKPVPAGYPTLVENTAPLAFTVSGAWPNPFNPTTTIRYQLPQSAHVRLTVFDVLGRKVAVLEDGLKGSGVHEVVWNARSANGAALGSGIYFWRLEADSYHAQGKMMLLR
jgi:hypothetical protein